MRMSCVRQGLRLAALCLLLCELAPAAETACPAEGCPTASACTTPLSGCQVRPQDEVWIVNSRGLCVSTPEASVTHLRYQRYVPERGWTALEFADFARQPADMVTSFFIVGNYYTHAETVEAGWYAYHRLVAACADEVKLRFVIWSWPTDPVPGRRLPDAKIKLTRVDPTAYHLAALVDRLDPATPISMCGSSYGVGISAGALQLLAGDRLDCYQLSPRSGATRRVRLVMLGAAIHNDGFLPGRKYDMALSQAERVLLVINPIDRALKVYHFLYGRRSGVMAMGRTGPVGLQNLLDGAKVDFVRSDPYVGHRHGMLPAWQSPTMVAWMRPYLLMQPVSVTRTARRH
jgi:hypothetical protein